MKNFSLFCLLLILLSSNNLNSQTVLQVNSSAFQISNDIKNGINLKEKDYQEVHQAYIEYESRLASLSINQGTQTGGYFGNKKELLLISLQKTIKSKLNPNKFDQYLTYTNQEDLTNMVDSPQQESTVSLNGDNANPNPPIINLPNVTLYEN